jgi:hypothetical protein
MILTFLRDVNKLFDKVPVWFVLDLYFVCADRETVDLLDMIEVGNVCTNGSSFPDVSFLVYNNLGGSDSQRTY